MAITITGSFESAKEQRGHYPIFLVELLSLGRFYATKEPGFTGEWLADQGLTATTTIDSDFEILVDDTQPTYETILHKLSNNGIGALRYELDDQGFARTGDGAVSLLNQAFLNLDLEPEVLENVVARIMLGFNGLARSDYISVFKGVIDSSSANLERFNLRLADDTQRNIVPVPAQIGNDFRPRAFDQGKAFPIILGHAEDVPMVQIVGDASSFLGQTLLTTDTELFYFNPNTRFPDAGTVRVTNSAVNYTVNYDGVTMETIGKVTYGKLALTSSPSTNTATGATVELENHTRKYVVSFAGQNIRRIRKSTGDAPAGNPTWTNEAIDPTGGDPRRITVVDLPHATTDGEQMIASIASEARQENQFFNGNFVDNATGWTVGSGAFDRFLPASTFDYVGRIRTLAAQTLQTDVTQDITVEPNVKYRMTFTARNVDLVFMAVNIGVPGNLTKYYQFGDIDGTAEQLFDLIFQPDEATLRITLIGDNAASGSAQSGYFDQFDLYKLSTENPSTQIEALIKTHMPQIEPNAASFSEAFDFYDDQGDIIAGLVQQTEEQQALLGRIAQQFRAKTFLNEDGEQVLRVFNQSRVPERTLKPEDISKGSMTVSRSPLAEVYTHYYVYYGRVPETPQPEQPLGGRSAFAGVAVATPEQTSHSIVELNTLCLGAKNEFRKERTLEVFADCISESGTAENLLEYIVRRGTHQRLRLNFRSWLRLVDIEVADFIKVQHPLLGSTLIYEVLEKELMPNGCETRWVVEEIAPMKFGSFTERWEPERARVKATINTEEWEPPQPGEELDGQLIEGNPFNPYLEEWEPAYASDSLFDMQQWDSTDALTSELYGAMSTMDTDPGNAYMSTPDKTGMAMFPNAHNSSNSGVESVPFRTPLQSKVYSNTAGSLLISPSTFAANSGSIELRPVASGSFGEFIRVQSHIEDTPNSNPGLAESYDFDGFRWSGIVNIERQFSIRVWVKLNNKADSYPIWQGYDQSNLGGDKIDRLPYCLYYNASTDRFEFGVGNNIPGEGNTLAANVASIAQKVQASTFGSPSAATWYQLVATYDPGTTTATIKVNAGTEDSNVITPDFTTSLSRAGLIGGWSLASDGSDLTTDAGRVKRVTLDGHVAHWAFWGRVITSAEATTLYGAGTPYRFDSI
jgi:hypothetical protein